MNIPNPIGDVPSTFDVYARPNPATLAPMFTPQVPLVPMQPHVSPFVMPPPVPYATLSPAKGGSAMESTAFKVSLVTLAILVVLWVARLLFFNKKK